MRSLKVVLIALAVVALAGSALGNQSECQPQTVPDIGWTVMMFGAALTAMGLVGRKIR